MTIKKPMKSAASPAAPATTGGATIADRFKLDAPPPPPKTSGGTKAAFIAGLLALAVAGILTYMLYKHWEFLMPA